MVYCFSCCSKLYVELPAFSGSVRNPRVEMQPKFALRPDSSVVERGPEKAGVGGSIPSLATTPSNLKLLPRSIGVNPARGPEKAYCVGGSIPSLATTLPFHPVPLGIKFPLNSLFSAN